MRREHFAEWLVPRGAQAAELDALVVLVEAQLALAVVEEGLAAVGAHGAQIEREFPVAGVCLACRRGAASTAAASAADLRFSSPMSAAGR